VTIGYADVAVRHARRCLELVEASPDAMADWDAPLAHEALARALAAAGVVNPVTGQPFTGELLFGVAGGIGFLYLVFDYSGWITVTADGRFNALYFEKKGFIETACGRLGLPVRVRPTSDRDATDRQVRQALATVPEVALTVELARVPGAAPGTSPMLPHPVTVSFVDSGPEPEAGSDPGLKAGSDSELKAGSNPDLTVVGLPRGRVTMSWDEVIEARWTHAKKYGGLYLFEPPAEAPDVRSALVQAIGRTADCLLEPGRGNSFDSSFGAPGIRRWARLLTDARDRKGWPKLFPEPEPLRDALDSVTRGLGGPGASGNASRRLYAAFLDQAAVLVEWPDLAAVADAYRDLGDRWAEVVQLAARPDATPADLAGPLPDLAEAEHSAALALRATVTALTDGGQPR